MVWHHKGMVSGVWRVEQKWKQTFGVSPIPHSFVCQPSFLMLVSHNLQLNIKLCQLTDWPICIDTRRLWWNAPAWPTRFPSSTSELTTTRWRWNTPSMKSSPQATTPRESCGFSRTAAWCQAGTPSTWSAGSTTTTPARYCSCRACRSPPPDSSLSLKPPTFIRQLCVLTESDATGGSSAATDHRLQCCSITITFYIIYMAKKTKTLSGLVYFF